MASGQAKSGRSLHGKSRTLTFDFVVATRPVYVPNSGPPLAPLSIMPAHDKNGIIADVLELDGSPVYVVSYVGKPHLRISVRPENIRNWVSARTHEEWDREQVRLRKEEEQRIRDENRKPKKGSRVATSEGPKGKPGRKRKRPPTLMEEEEQSVKLRRNSALGKVILPATSGPGRRRKPVTEEAIFLSPKAPQKSPGPSLSTPVKGLAEVIDLDTDEEDMDNSLALDLQLNGGLVQQAGTQSTETTTPQQSRSSSRGASLLDEKQASISSRQARQIYEDLEKGKIKPIAERYSNLPRKSMFAPGDSRANTSTSPSTKPFGSTREYGVEVEEDEIDYVEELSDENESDTWEVDRILDDEIRMDHDGQERIYYLIKWVGDWDNTWEPEVNVGDEAIQEYEIRRGRRTPKLDAKSESGNELFLTPEKRRGKVFELSEPIRGQVIDDDYGDSSD